MLESLRTRPATKEDIGKMIYHQYHEPIKINNFFIEEMNQSDWYWQQPAPLISKEEYEELKANQIKGRCKDCDKWKDYTYVSGGKYKGCSRFNAFQTKEKWFCSEFKQRDGGVIPCGGCKYNERLENRDDDRSRRLHCEQCEENNFIEFEPKAKSVKKCGLCGDFCNKCEPKAESGKEGIK